MQRPGLGEAVLRGHAAIAGMRVAQEAGVHAGTVAGGRLMAPVTQPDIVNPRIEAFLQAQG